MTEPKWVLEEVVRAIHTMLLSEHGGATGIRDEAMLQLRVTKINDGFIPFFYHII